MAASILINVLAKNIGAEKIAVMQNVVEKYLGNQYYNADRPEGLTSLGTFYLQLKGSDPFNWEWVMCH